jgi:hypothetical protein
MTGATEGEGSRESRGGRGMAVRSKGCLIHSSVPSAGHSDKDAIYTIDTVRQAMNINE